MRPMHRNRSRRACRGFTLVEIILVIAITGIIAAMVAVFLRHPIDAYVDTARRASLSDTADTALRRIARDLRRAIPNTVRVTNSSGVFYLEFIPARAGGRYRLDENCFTTGCSSLTTLGSLVDDASNLPSLCVGNGTPTGCVRADRLVIYNQYNNAAADCAVDNPSAYCEFSGGDAASPVNGVTAAGNEDVIAFASNVFVPANGSATGRFQIAEGPVTYACNPGSGQLLRYYDYALAAAQPTPPTGGRSAILATGVSACGIAYTTGAFERWGLVAIQLGLTRDNESVTLYQEVHVDNAP